MIGRNVLMEFMERQKITAYQFAKMSGVPQSTIRSIVQKEDYEVRESNMKKICAGMGITPYELRILLSNKWRGRVICPVYASFWYTNVWKIFIYNRALFLYN
jgi:hypothetical protein